MADSPQAVITGLGAVSPHGLGVGRLWEGLLAGRSAFAALSLFDASMFRNPLAGMVSGFPAEPGAPARALRMLQAAADEAWRDALGLPLDADDAAVTARLDSDPAARKGSIVTGTNFGGMSAAEAALIEGRADPRKANLNGYLFGTAGELLAERFQMHGARLNLSLSCASGTAAIALASKLIRQGRAEVVLAAGYDELSLFVYAGLSALRAITPETLRPFDKRRKGTLFSEGAGVVLVESLEHARQRQAPHIYAEIPGCALNNDAYHMTAPETEARGIQALMRAALADARTEPDSVDHLNLHATGTPYNDAIETKAVHAVFGERGRKIPVASVKSSIGHAMGAAGTLETIATVLSLRDGKIPPIVGLDPNEKDPQCDLLTPTGAPLAGDFRTALKTSYGFGGTNAALVLRRN